MEEWEFRAAWRGRGQFRACRRDRGGRDCHGRIRGNRDFRPSSTPNVHDATSSLYLTIWMWDRIRRTREGGKNEDDLLVLRL